MKNSKEEGSVRRELTVNGRKTTAVADPASSLLEYLRGERGLTGTKNGCATGHCGACQVAS